MVMQLVEEREKRKGSLPPFLFPFLAIFPQTESLFTGYSTCHTKTTCRSPPCSNIDFCKIKDKHPDQEMRVNELQREIKWLQSQAAEEEENIKRLASAQERAKTSFFAVMGPRLKAQNLLQYGTGKRIQLSRDLLILQRALNNKVPDWPESQDWKLPLIIGQFRNSQLKAMMPKFL